MKKTIKNLILNILSVGTICFLLLFVFFMWQDYVYYSSYPKETLSEFFSLKDTLIWDLGLTIRYSFKQMIAYIPIILLLEKTKLNNIAKIIITVALIQIISFIYVIISIGT